MQDAHKTGTYDSNDTKPHKYTTDVINVSVKFIPVCDR